MQEVSPCTLLPAAAHVLRSAPRYPPRATVPGLPATPHLQARAHPQRLRSNSLPIRPHASRRSSLLLHSLSSPLSLFHRSSSFICQPTLSVSFAFISSSTASPFVLRCEPTPSPSPSTLPLYYLQHLISPSWASPSVVFPLCHLDSLEAIEPCHRAPQSLKHQGTASFFSTSSFFPMSCGFGLRPRRVTQPIA